MSPVLLVHHAANWGLHHPPGSPPGLQACLDGGARAVEMDVCSTADGELVLLHGPDLDRETDGRGPVSKATADEVAGLHYRQDNDITDVPVGLLGQALELIEGHAQPVELQLDLKPYGPLTPAGLARLAERLRPVRDRIRVSSMADWLLRRLRALDPELPLGFDPLLYLDVADQEDGVPAKPPFRAGAYGYLDEHPLASWRWGAPAAYLALRAEALWVQAPAGALWYINARLLGRALDDGFDWIADLHRRGARVAAWTLDGTSPEDLALARRLVGHGVDRIITNDAPSLAEALGDGVVY